MLYKLLAFAAVLSTADAFTAPVSAVGASRTAGVSMADTSWRRSFDGRGGAATAAAPAAAAAPSGSLTVGQACAFMQNSAIAGASVADVTAYLKSKGVDDFTIQEAYYTLPVDNVQGA
jgi:hypothetical protein